MNFEDPFASDLRNFGSTANAMRRGGGSGETGESQGSLGGAASGAPARTTSPSGGIIDFDIGGPGGRRRRAGDPPTAVGTAIPSLAPLAHQGVQSAVAAGLPPAGRRQQPQPQPQPQHVDADAAPWLAGGGPLAVNPSVQQQRQPQRDTLVIDDDDPLAFLEGNALSRQQRGEGGGALSGGGGAPSRGGRAATVSPEAAAAAVAKAKQAEEIRELHAQLYALDEENTRADEKLSLQQTKEEAELLTLATTVIEKSMELEQQEAQLQEQCDKVRKSTKERMDAAHRRYAEELAEQDAEVRRLEGDRYGRQLKQLTLGLTEVEAALGKLRQQKRLLIDEDPFSSQSLALALSPPSPKKTEGRGTEEATYPSTTSATDGEDDAEGALHGITHADRIGVTGGGAKEGRGESTITTTTTSDGEEGALSSDPYERTMQRGVAILKRYCDQHLGSIKDNIVDYLHHETLTVAHNARTQSLLAWTADAADRKERLGEHVQGMMQRYLDMSHTRSELKQASLRLLHEELAATSRQLRQDAAERLKRLTTEVTAKLSATTEGFERIAQEHHAYVQQKVAQTIAGDMAMAQAQHDEVAQRLATEDSVRRQLREAAKSALADQLAKLRARHAADSEAAFAKAREGAAAGASDLCEPLRARAGDLKQLIDTLAESEKKARQQRQRQGWWAGAGKDTTDTIALVMSQQERQGSLQALQSVVRRTHDELLDSRGHLHETYHQLTSCLGDHVQALREKRLAQQSHQSAIDFTRTAWERDHQRSLKMALPLSVPVLFSPTRATGVDSGGATGMGSWPSVVSSNIESHAAPGDVMLVALLEFVEGALADRTKHFQELQSKRKGTTSTHERELANLATQINAVRKLWASVMESASCAASDKEAFSLQQLGLHKEMVENRVRREALAWQRDLVEQRRAALEAKGRECDTEGEAVMRDYRAAQEKLGALADDQLRLAMEEQHARVATLAATKAYTPSQFLRDCTNDNCDNRMRTKQREAKPRRVNEESCESSGIDSCTPPQQEQQRGTAGGRQRCPPLSPSSTPPPAKRGASPPDHKVRRPHDQRDTVAHRSPFSSTSTSAREQRYRTAAAAGDAGGSSSHSPPDESSSRFSSTAPAGGGHTGRHRPQQGHGQETGSSPFLDSSTVSVSSFYRSGTFIDLATVLDSTTTISGMETP